MPEKPQIYSKTIRGRTIHSDLNPTYFDLEGSGKIRSYFIFSESQDIATNLEALAVELTDAKDGTRVPVTKSDLVVSYWNGRNTVEIRKSGYTESLSLLLPPEIQQSPSRSIHSVTYSYHLEYETIKLPDELTQTITIRFKNRAVSMKTLLRKQKFEKAFISGRPFG
ncbi:MAG: hypothetical protein ACOY5B_07220 [Spirochaetota bacterium]